MLNTSPVPVEFMVGRAAGRVRDELAIRPVTRAARAKWTTTAFTPNPSPLSAVSKSGQPVNWQSSCTLRGESTVPSDFAEKLFAARNLSLVAAGPARIEVRSSDVVMPRRRASAEQTRVSTFQH